MEAGVRRLGGGQLDRYLLRRLAAPVALSLGLILAALLLDKALRLVQALSDSGARLEFLAPLMAALSPYFLVTAAPFAFFAGLLICVSGLDADGEIEAILASGVSPERLAAPFVATGAVMALAVLAVSAWPEPLGRFGYSQAMAHAQQAGWSGRLEPGVVFAPQPGSSLEAEQVLLVGHRLRGVFETRRNPAGGETVTTAREGAWNFVHGGRDVALTLHDGSVLRDEGGSATFGRFDTLDEIQPSGVAAADPVRGGDERELTLPELFGGLGAPGHRGRVVAAELAVKLVQAAALVFLPLFAVPLALASKRGGRAPGLIVAVASLAAFHHAVEFFKGLVVNGRLASAGPIVACLAAFAGPLHGGAPGQPGPPWRQPDHPHRRVAGLGDAGGAAARCALRRGVVAHPRLFGPASVHRLAVRRADGSRGARLRAVLPDRGPAGDEPQDPVPRPGCGGAAALRGPEATRHGAAARRAGDPGGRRGDLLRARPQQRERGHAGPAAFPPTAS